VKIGIVNDKPAAVEALRKVLALDADLSVAWVASNGAEAVERCTATRPDVVLMELAMPVMDGAEATRRIMAASPCAIIIAATDVDGQTGHVFDAMGYGALDAIEIPAPTGADLAAHAAPLLRKIRNAGWLIGAYDRPRRAPRQDRAPAGVTSHKQLVVIGASAGGPPSLALLLKGLPLDFPAGIVLVQHVDASFAQDMARWLDEQVAMPVRLAMPGDTPCGGTVLLAGTDDHLVMQGDGTLAYTRDPIEGLYRPSIDVFFKSVAQFWRGDAVGVLLTGMGRDGAQGLKTMRERGFLTIAQDRASSAVYGMPKAAAELNAAVEITPLERIAERLAIRFAHMPT
jgi:two-component system response regulator WspF